MRAVILVAAAATALTVVAPGANAAPDRTVTVEAGQTFTWKDAAETNANPFYFAQVAQQPDVAPVQQGTCSTSPHQACDEVLVKLVNPLTQADLDAGRPVTFRGVTVEVKDYEPVAEATDFDLQIFASDANGTRGEMLAQSGELAGEPESAGATIATTASQPSRYVLVRVIRFLSVNATYRGTIRF